MYTPAAVAQWYSTEVKGSIQWNSLNGQRHAKRDLRTYAKSVDSDQPPRLRRRVWSESALFDTRHINSTYISCYVSNWITYSYFQFWIGADLGLHYLQCPNVPFRVTLAILFEITSLTRSVPYPRIVELANSLGLKQYLDVSLGSRLPYLTYWHFAKNPSLMSVFSLQRKKTKYCAFANLARQWRDLA